MSTDTTLDAFLDVQQEQDIDKRELRAEALEGGARYRSPPTTTVDDVTDDVGDETNCQCCGESVTLRFRRTFGDNDNVAWGCFDCHTASAIKRGAAKDEDCDGEIADGIMEGV